jgi:hypothetical protein
MADRAGIFLIRNTLINIDGSSIKLIKSCKYWVKYK